MPTARLTLPDLLLGESNSRVGVWKLLVELTKADYVLPFSLGGTVGDCLHVRHLCCPECYATILTHKWPVCQ